MHIQWPEAVTVPHCWRWLDAASPEAHNESLPTQVSLQQRMLDASTELQLPAWTFGALLPQCH